MNYVRLRKDIISKACEAQGQRLLTITQYDMHMIAANVAHIDTRMASPNVRISGRVQATLLQWRQQAANTH